VALTASLGRLDEVRAFLASDLPAEFASLTPSVELILEEFLVNVVKHAYEGKPGPLEASLRFVAFDGRPHLALKVVDWGPPFNPFSDAPEPDVTLDVDSRSIGGLGIRLVRSMAAHHSYFRSGGANTVEVWIKSPNPAPS
jgi:anti-sigma regulatory factor (Ser/Thr protein kinase)